MPVDVAPDRAPHDLIAANPEGSDVVTYAKSPWQLTFPAIIAGLAALTVARVFLVPVALAFLLALVFSPIRRWAERKGVAPGITAAVVILVLVVVLTGLTVLLAAPLSGWLEQAPEIAREVERKLRALAGATQALMDAGEQIDSLTTSGEVARVVVRDVGIVADVAFGAPLVAAQTVTVLVLLFFLTASGDMIYEKIVHVLPTFRDKRRAMHIAREIERKLSHYLATITLINAGLGVAIGLALWVVGMPNPMLFGVVAFALNFVPFVGALAGTFFALLVGFVSFAEPAQALFAGAVYFGLTSLEGQLITPHFVGRSLKLNTVVIFLSVALWAWLWSIMGMLLAVPLLVTIRTICEHVPKLKGVGDFLSARGAEVENRVN